MMMKKLMISALLLGASVCHAVTIGAHSTTQAPKTEHPGVQSKKAPEVSNVTHHHHHYYHYSKKPVSHVRREVYYRPYYQQQPVKVRSYRYIQPRIVYPAPVVSGAGVHFAIR